MSQEGFKILHLCEALGVGRSSYYKWLNRRPSERDKREEWLIDKIIQAYDKHKGIYGYRRITIYLNYYENAQVNHKCVYRLMRKLGLKAVIRKKRYSWKPSKAQHTAENKLNREFQTPYGPFEVLLTDVTEFKYGDQSKAYLSAVLDYGDNKIISYQLSTRNDNDLVFKTFTPIKDKIIPKKTLIHSDRGFQYTSHWFNSFIEETQAIQSMSRAGRCIDNGPMENLWGIIKEEMYRLNSYDSLDELKDDIDRYISFYNDQRVTLKMGLRIPA